MQLNSKGSGLTRGNIENFKERENKTLEIERQNY